MGEKEGKIINHVTYFSVLTCIKGLATARTSSLYFAYSILESVLTNAKLHSNQECELSIFLLICSKLLASSYIPVIFRIIVLFISCKENIVYFELDYKDKYILIRHIFIYSKT